MSSRPHTPVIEVVRDSSDAPPRGPIVVKVGGALLDDDHALDAIANALADANAARPGSLVIVHGGGTHVDRHLDRIGAHTERRDGIRVTPPALMPEIAAVLAGRVGTAIVGRLVGAGAPAVGLRLGDGGIARCRVSTRHGADVGAVGEVVDGDATVLHALGAAGRLPVVASIGFDDDGAPLNINADEAAAAIARIAGARALLLLTDVPGVLDGSGSVVPSLDESGVDRLIAEGVVTGGMIPKLRGALEASRHADCPAVIASWRSPEVLAAALAEGALPGTRVDARLTDTTATSAAPRGSGVAR